MTKKLIPRHLIPVSERDITDQWAMDNYRYRCHFNCTVSNPIAGETEIKEWRKEARSISDILKRDGIMHAENEVISLCNTRYAHKLTNGPVANVYDIVKLFDDNASIQDDHNTFLDMLHMFQYGIFRCAYNAWAVDAASSWLEQRNLAYEPGPDSVKRKGKGFVYKLLVNRASNTICVRFQKLSLRLYNEYVIVRDKKIEDKRQNFDIIPHVFNLSYRGYIMQSKQSNGNLKSDELSVEDKTSVLDLVRKAVQCGETVETIKTILQNHIDEKMKGNTFLHIAIILFILMSLTLFLLKVTDKTRNKLFSYQVQMN